MSYKNSFSIIAAALVAAMCPSTSRACGPFFPSTVIFAPDSTATDAPVADMWREMARIKPANDPKCKAIPPEEKLDEYARTTAADLAELKAAIAAMPAARQQELLKQYTQLRSVLKGHGRGIAGSEDEDRKYAPPPTDKPHPSPTADKPRPLEGATVPPGLPQQFALYVQGAIEWYSDKDKDAIAAWEKLLALPADQRRLRSTWAAFMIGRASMRSDPDKARRYFQMTRKLAADGFADSTGLAAASLGLEARVEFDALHYEQAMELYVEQGAAGDGSAYNSLYYVCSNLVKRSQSLLPRLATDRVGRQVVTAFVISHCGPIIMGDYEIKEGAGKITAAWLNAVSQANVKNVEQAERLAWAAYQAGNYKLARNWLDKAKPDEPMTLWISAKLAMREGKMDAALAALAKAAKAFPANEEWAYTDSFTPPEEMSSDSSFSPRRRTAGELATILLARGQYVESLDVLVRNGWWEDAAYIAERVLTPDELVGYVKKNWPAPKKQLKAKDVNEPPTIEDNTTSPDVQARDIRHLLARRLTRLGRWKEAREFYPADLQGVLDKYIAGIRGGADDKRSPAERGQSLWSAAKIARESGMELMGTELAPDYFIWEGAFNNVIETGKDKWVDDDGTSMPRDKKARLLGPSRDEQERFDKSAPAIRKRFHYRYIATEHAWQAAALMPDQSPQTAEVLCTAGRWIAARDPKEADKFYKALVRRCGKTDLGRLADELKWFPDPPPTATAKPRT